MEPALDEASLILCATMPPADRVQGLASTLKALDSIGAPRVLRSVRDAADRDISDGRGLRQWCFDRRTLRDAGRFVAFRLDKAPFIDGNDGLLAVAEAGRAIQPSIDGKKSLGGGYVALTDSVLVVFPGSTWPPARPVVVRLEVLTEDDEWTDNVTVDAVDSSEEVVALSEAIAQKVESAVTTGGVLVERLPNLFPRLVLGERAAKQIADLTGSEPFYRQVLRHFRALNRAAERWTPGTPFVPEGITFSVEGEPTLRHGNFGRLRDFPTPAGFETQRWTLHTKLTGGNGARLYYKTQESEEVQSGAESIRRLFVAVGYVGPHLPTVKFN